MKDGDAAAGPKILDPVCGMIVALDDARDHGLALEMPDREYAFCSSGCLRTFAKTPERFRAQVDAWVAANPQP